jgi:hypothetical protein
MKVQIVNFSLSNNSSILVFILNHEFITHEYLGTSRIVLLEYKVNNVRETTLILTHYNTFIFRVSSVVPLAKNSTPLTRVMPNWGVTG